MKRKFTWNSRITAGLLIGLLTPVVAIPLVLELIAVAQDFMFQQLWYKFVHDRSVQSKFLSLSCLPNLGWFYLFINRERFDLGRGVIIGTAIYIPYIIYLVFF